MLRAHQRGEERIVVEVVAVLVVRLLRYQAQHACVEETPPARTRQPSFCQP